MLQPFMVEDALRELLAVPSVDRLDIRKLRLKPPCPQCGNELASMLHGVVRQPPRLAIATCDNPGGCGWKMELRPMDEALAANG